jgi:hypothetical protein
VIVPDTSDANMGLQKNSMKNSLKHKVIRAGYAGSTSLRSPLGWRLTIIIEQVKSEDSSATTVITDWWGVIPTRTLYSPYLSI